MLHGRHALITGAGSGIGAAVALALAQQGCRLTLAGRSQEKLQRQAEVTPGVVARLRACRDLLVPLLAELPGVQVAPARGGMYAFFRLEGFDDSLALARRLVAEAGLGLAPGNAFAPEAEGWLRWCFASRDSQRLVDGVARLRRWLAAQGRG